MESSPSGRAQASGCLFDLDLVYVFGGIDLIGKPLFKTIDTLDLSTNLWTTQDIEPRMLCP